MGDCVENHDSRDAKNNCHDYGKFLIMWKTGAVRFKSEVLFGCGNDKICWGTMWVLEEM